MCIVKLIGTIKQEIEKWVKYKKLNTNISFGIFYSNWFQFGTFSDRKSKLLFCLPFRITILLEFNERKSFHV